MQEEEIGDKRKHCLVRLLIESVSRFPNNRNWCKKKKEDIKEKIVLCGRQRTRLVTIMKSVFLSTISLLSNKNQRDKIFSSKCPHKRYQPKYLHLFVEEDKSISSKISTQNIFVFSLEEEEYPIINTASWCHTGCAKVHGIIRAGDHQRKRTGEVGDAGKLNLVSLPPPSSSSNQV